MTGLIIEIHEWTFNLILLSKWEGRGASMEILKSNVIAAHCSAVESIRGILWGDPKVYQPLLPQDLVCPT